MTGSSELLYRHQIAVVDIACAMKQALAVRDRKWRLKTYRKTFVGSEAVHWLIDRNYAVTLHEATHIGRTMLRMGLVVSVVESIRTLENSNTLYRFAEDNYFASKQDELRLRLMSSRDSEYESDNGEEDRPVPVCCSFTSSADDEDETMMERLSLGHRVEQIRAERLPRYRERTHRSPLRRPTSPRSPRRERRKSGRLMW
mmetsp:Transcript_54907/g.134585  ORF Transcript_54907/g.134585 Transcript_54907/m.134585 type:complete len:200 (+) Transcript_54907:199-798(+)